MKTYVAIFSFIVKQSYISQSNLIVLEKGELYIMNTVRSISSQSKKNYYFSKQTNKGYYIGLDELKDLIHHKVLIVLNGFIE